MIDTLQEQNNTFYLVTDEEREDLKREETMHIRESGNILKKNGFGPIVSENERIQDIIQLCERIAPYDTTVLITGESGTGKELIARGIHCYSQRSDGDFFAINCGSIPENLLESELFGYMKGSFTGADRNKKGMFEEADGSTLFLDEIGELPLSMQVKLLRVLQEGEVRPVGASAAKKVHVRIVAATARDLARDVKRGVFREDLFYRLNVVSIKLPPLRNRLDDIPLLCRHFMKKYRDSLKNQVDTVSPDAMAKLMRYHWPGNIRELENVIQRGMVIAEDNTIGLEHLSPDIVNGRTCAAEAIPYSEGFSLKVAQKKLEAKMIRVALEETENNKSKAARLLEISYPSLLNKIKEYNIAF